MNWPSLPDFHIIERKNNRSIFEVVVETRLQPAVCPHCGSNGGLYKHGTREHVFPDTPLNGKHVKLHIHRKRYKCTGCRRTFWERLGPSMDERRKCTTRLVEYIETECLTSTFVDVSIGVGVDEKTVRNIFSGFIDRINRRRRIDAPAWIGISELRLSNPRSVVTDVEHCTVIDILPDQQEATIIAFLEQLPARDCIQHATIDTLDSFRSAIHKVLPNATILIEPTDVALLANRELEAVCNQVQRSLPRKLRTGFINDRHLFFGRETDLDMPNWFYLRAWTGYSSSLDITYKIKESFSDIWNSVDQHEARSRYLAWKTDIPETAPSSLTNISHLTQPWEEEIFNAFNHPNPGEYIQLLQNLKQLIGNIGRKYSFDAQRARILLSECALTDDATGQHLGQEGIDMSMLVEKIQAGEL